MAWLVAGLGHHPTQVVTGLREPVAGVAGLGNPGDRFAKTRHNLGRMVAEAGDEPGHRGLLLPAFALGRNFLGCTFGRSLAFRRLLLLLDRSLGGLLAGKR